MARHSERFKYQGIKRVDKEKIKTVEVFNIEQIAEYLCYVCMYIFVHPGYSLTDENKSVDVVGGGTSRLTESSSSSSDSDSSSSSSSSSSSDSSDSEAG